jgi:hypothetical protein
MVELPEWLLAIDNQPKTKQKSAHELYQEFKEWSPLIFLGFVFVWDILIIVCLWPSVFPR